MAISIKNNQFHLTTKNKSYIFCVYNDAFLVHIYWGDRIENDIDMTDFPEELIYPRTNAFHVATNTTNKMFLSDLQLEYAYAVGDYRVPSFVAKYENNSTVTEFEYISHKVYHGKNRVNGLPTTIGDDNTDTLEVELSDKLTGLTVYLIYSVFENYDVITRSVRYENRGESDIHLLSAQSACIDFSGQNYKILHLHGDWSRERFVEYTDVKHGIFTIDSKRGMSSHMNNPFFALMDKNADEIKGEVYGFCLMYSGNFCADIEGSSCGTTRVTMGINPYNFDWTLKKNEVFNTPEVVMVHTSNGLGEMSCKYHKLIRDRVCKGKWADKERPVIANNWDGMRFDFNEEKLYSLVERAAEVGVEMFVLDDGWFGKRNNNRCSLGDWTINKDKFPNGLANFVNSVNSYGMKFGLWFEPEMISPDSDLYRLHSDWCIYAENRKRTENRQQLVLDITRMEVRDYIVNAVSNILDSANIEYIKWDCNRNITETKNQMQSHQYVLGLYEILERLTSKYPDILFEGCSGGGGRFDLGMLYYMPQTWTSDNVNAITRIFTQYGTSMVYPPITIAAHIGGVDVGFERENMYMNTCAMVAMSGNFGYEFNMQELSKIETKQAKQYAEFYKEIRKTIQFGDCYRLEDPFCSNFCSLEFIDETKVVLFTYQLRQQTNGEERRIKLRGLDKNSIYKYEDKEYVGEQLMKIGIRIPLGKYDYASDCKVFTKVQ